MTSIKSSLLQASLTAFLVMASGLSTPARADLPVAQTPLSVGSSQSAPPLNMLVMGRDHKLYYEAYNDASDLNGDGVLDVGYKGHLPVNQGGIDYFGYFDSHRCYSYDASGLKFSPGAAAPNKTCSNAWSGDFLNYLTTSRMDAMRKVLYGGYRVTDTTTATTLERAYIPQDAHTWGKEYTSVSVDGYRITAYAPLSQPVNGKRHLFANVTLRNAESDGPLLRVATNSGRRIWNWVAKENPVAGDDCSGGPCAGGAVTHPGHPRSRGEFDTMETEYAIPDNLQGTSSLGSIDCSSNDCNPHGDDENYLTIITGEIEIRQQGNYVFHIDGDDNIDFIMRDQNGNVVAGTGCYPNGRGFGGACDAGAPSVAVNSLPIGIYSFKFRHEEAGGGDGYRLSWQRTDSSTFSTRVLKVVDQHIGGGGASNANASGGYVSNPSFSFYTLVPSNAGSTMTNYRVRVDVCVAGALESNCKRYANGHYKPTGILHDYGEGDRMMFGLLTGSYAKNTQGGVLRKNASSFKNEVDSNTGQFTGIVGIVRTIDRLRTIDFNAYNYTCGWIATRPINDGECSMWGNPVAEMMYETLRYLSGASAPRSEFAIANNAKDTQAPLQLPMPDWKPPYTAKPDGGGYLRCATPVMTVISDINPSYDGSVPGSNWNSISATSDPAPVSNLNVSTQVNAIWTGEGGGTHKIFIGESDGIKDSNPTVKSVSNLSTVRGLAPEEPSKEGTYYSAGVARFGATNQIGGIKNAMTYSVALASPLPRLEFKVGDKTITVVPLAKSVGEYGIDGTGDFQPTNQIVDFFVQKIANTDPGGRDRDMTVNGGLPYAEFRINYEDVEQGADHDMDAIALYTLKVNLAGELEISLSSEYASGSIVQYMGYIISGTTKDGIYLEVSDCDTQSTYASNSYCNAATGVGAFRYKLNTPPGRDAGYCANSTNLASAECFSLPYSASRIFVPGNTPGAKLLNGPLWYAAKYGRPTSFNWDEDGDHEPDNYFLVTNAGTLKAQLDKAFAQIIADTQNSGGVAASGARANEGFMAYVPEFTTTDWTGDLRAHKLDPATGALLPAVWRAGTKLEAVSDAAVVTQTGRKVYYVDPAASPGARQKDFTVTELGTTPAATAAKLGVSNVSTVSDVVDYLRGDHSKEQRNNGVFRNRSTRIGDIFSQPAVLDKASHGYLNLPVAQGGGYGTGGYAKFVESKDTRTPVVFVSANDGFIHAFNATDNATTGGQELFAIAPASVLQNMGQLASPSYTHRYYVNESPTQGDAYLDGNWKTVLLAATGAGARSVVALDVTNPIANGAQVLWEYSNTSSGGADLGLTIGTPKIALLPSGQWAAVFGNGYNSDNHLAYLYIVNLETGALIAKVATGNEGSAATPNGLASPALIDLDGDGATDLVYAGDYRGNLWRIPLSASGSVLNAPTATRLFTAQDTAIGNRQHITGGVTASIHPSGGQLVFFGTGSYFLDGDNAPASNSDQVQSFYGIWDENNGNTVSRSALQRQEFTTEGTGRKTTTGMVNWSTQKGWYIDLKIGGQNADGERFIGQPTISLGSVQFWTFVSQGDECEPGGFNWNNMLSTTTGIGSLGTGLGGVGGFGSDRPSGSEGQPITSKATIVTVRAGGDAGTEDCDPSDPSCTPPTPPTGSDGNPMDLGQVMPQGCVVTVSLLTAAGLNPQARLACGRLSWRQMQ